MYGWLICSNAACSVDFLTSNSEGIGIANERKNNRMFYSEYNLGMEERFAKVWNGYFQTKMIKYLPKCH